MACNCPSLAVFFLSIDSTGVWTQGLALTKQALHPLRYTSSPFCISLFFS
jgi:hypothetical protein